MNNSIPLNIGDRIKAVLKVQKMTQTKLANGIGVSPAFLNQVISGKRKVSLALLQSIAIYMDIPLYSFFLEVGEESAQNNNFVFLQQLVFEACHLSDKEIMALLPIVAVLKRERSDLS